MPRGEFGTDGGRILAGVDDEAADGGQLRRGLKNHIVGFFVNANGLCKLTLMVGDAEKPTAPASRLLLVVDPGRGARFDADDGNTLQFACKSGATAMTASKIKSVAAAPVEE